MKRRATFVIFPAVLGLAALPARAQIVAADSVTPRDTSPSMPTDSVAEEVRHVVKRGDTLWDLAQYYLRNPFNWPQIFQRNTEVVENPHWIYPGEILRIPVREVRPAALREATEQGIVVSRVVARPSGPSQGPTAFSQGLERVTIEIGPIERERGNGLRQGEIEAAPFLAGRSGPPGAGSIVGTAERPAVAVDPREQRLQLNDHVYVVGPSGASLSVGTELLAFAQAAEISDAVRLMAPTGVVRIVEPAIGRRPARARLVRQYGEVFVGQRLITAPQPIPNGRELVAVTGETRSSVIWVHSDPVLPSLQHFVLLAPPRGESFSPGDRITLIDQTARGAADTLTPPEDAALVQVVRVTPLGATAVVVAQKLPTISRGMHARLSARLR